MDQCPWASYTTAQNIPVDGGTGQGLTVDIITNDDGSIRSFIYNKFGSGYTKGDEVVISGGDGGAKFVIANVADTIANARMGIASRSLLHPKVRLILMKSRSSGSKR